MRKSEGSGAGVGLGIGVGSGVLGTVESWMVDAGVCAETVTGLVEVAEGASCTMLSMTGS